MANILDLLIFLLSVAVIFFVIMQQRGAGAGAAFGSDSGFYHTRRGLERFFFFLTILTIALLVELSLFRLIIVK